MILIKTKLAQSSIHGIGLFAQEFIPKGTKVWEFTEGFEVVLTPEQTKKLSPAAREQFFNYAYLSKSTGNYVLCTDDARFFNHSTNANTICEVPKNAKSPEALVCFAAKDIEAGEELTNDYREFDADPSDVIK